MNTNNDVVNVFANGRYMSTEQEKVLFKTVNQFKDVYSRRDYAWMIILVETGLRIGSFQSLTVADAELAVNNKYILIKAENMKGKRKEHQVFVTYMARNQFKVLLDIHEEMKANYSPNSPLVMSRNHKALSIRSYQSRMKYWREKAGLPVDVSPHWFRHTKARALLEKSTSKQPLVEVANVLGHTSLNSSAIYTAPTREDINKVVERSSLAYRINS